MQQRWFHLHQPRRNIPFLPDLVVYPLQNFPEFLELRGEAPFFGLGGVVLPMMDKAVAVNSAAPVLLIRFPPAHEIPRENPSDPPAVLDAPLLGDVVPGLQEGGQVLRP